MKRSGINVRVFLQFFAPFMLILIITLTASSIYFHRAQRALLEGEQANSISVIRSGIQLIDERMADANAQLSKLLNDRDFVGFFKVSAPLASRDYLAMRQLSQRLGGFFLGGNGFVKTAIMYYNRSGVFIGEGVATARARMYYDGNIAYPGLTFDQFLEKIHTDKRMNQFFPANVQVGKMSAPLTKNAIGYVRLVPNLSAQRAADAPYRGFVMLLFDEAQIQRQFMSSTYVQEGWLCIVDEMGQVLASQNMTEDAVALITEILAGPSGTSQWSGNAMTVIRERSNLSGWNYIVGMETARLFKETTTLRNIFFVVIFAVFIVSAALCAILAIRYSTPMSRIVRELLHMESDIRLFRRQANIYSFVEGKLNQLITSNRAVVESIGVYNGIIYEVFLERLLLGRFAVRSEFDKMLALIDTPPNAARYTVLAFHLELFANQDDASGNTMLYMPLAKDVIASIVGAKGGVTIIGDARIGVMLMLNADLGRPYITMLSRRIIDELLLLDNLRVFVSAGQLYGELWDVQYSSAQALEVLDNLPASHHNSIFFYEDMEARRPSFMFTADQEHLLCGLIKRGSQKEVDEFLGALFQTIHNVSLPMSEFKQV